MKRIDAQHGVGRDGEDHAVSRLAEGQTLRPSVRGISIVAEI